MHVQAYTLGDVILKITCEDDQQARKLQNCFCSYFSFKPVSSTPGTETISLHFHLPIATPMHHADAVLIEEVGHLAQWRTSTGIRIQCERSVLDLNILHSRGVGVLHERFWSLPGWEQRDFFQVGLLSLLRPHGHHGLHANGVCINGRALLICGVPQAGKTTLTLSLVKAGWDFLADDAVLLHHHKVCVQALALRRGFSCRLDTLRTTLHWRTAGTIGLDLGDGRRLLAANHVITECTLHAWVPQVLLFPKIYAGKHSSICSLDTTTAFTLLIQQSVGFLRDQRTVHDFLELAQRLTQQAQTYQIHCGTDVFDAPASVALMIANTCIR